MKLEEILTLPIIRGVIRLLSSARFWALFIPVLATYGLELSPEAQALILLIAGGTWAGTTAVEDYAEKRSSGPSQTSVMTTAPASVTVNQPAAADGEQGAAVKVDETAGDGVGSVATGDLPKAWRG
jgi:hypothetical protein